MGHHGRGEEGRIAHSRGKVRTEDACAFDLEFWSAPVLTALFCRTNINQPEKAPSSRSTPTTPTPNEAASADDAGPPHGKFRCFELPIQRRRKGQITEFWECFHMPNCIPIVGRKNKGDAAEAMYRAAL